MIPNTDGKGASTETRPAYVGFLNDFLFSLPHCLVKTGLSLGLTVSPFQKPRIFDVLF